MILKAIDEKRAKYFLNVSHASEAPFGRAIAD
jgi:hypothetical protein